MLDDNIWQQLDYSLQLNNSRKGTWSAAFTITVIIEFLRTHEGRVDCKKAVPMALFKHDCSPHLHCIHPPAQGWHWACFKWSSNKLRACSSSWLLHHDFGGPTYIKDTTVGYRLDHYPAIFCSRCDSSQGWPPVQLMAPWAILPLCVMVSSHASEFFRRVRLCFSKDLFLWKQLLLYSGSCSSLSPRKSSCQWSWPKTIISMPFDLNHQKQNHSKNYGNPCRKHGLQHAKIKKTRWMNNALVRQRHVHLLSPTILLVFISEDRWWLSRCGAKHLKHSKSFPTLQTIQTTSWYADI